jgi:hypothetical protein
LKKRPSPHLQKVPTRRNVSPRTLQTAFVHFSIVFPRNLDLKSDLHPSAFPTEILNLFFISPRRLHIAPISSLSWSPCKYTICRQFYVTKQTRSCTAFRNYIFLKNVTELDRIMYESELQCYGVKPRCLQRQKISLLHLTP